MAARNTYFQDENIEKKIDMKQFGKIMRYIVPYGHLFAFVVILMFVSAGASMISPLLLRHIINDISVSKEMKDLIYTVAGLACCAAIEIAVTFAHQRIMGTAGHKIIAKIRQDAFYKLQKLPFDYFDSRPDGKIVVRVTDYVNDLANFFTNYVVNFMVYIIKIAVVTVFMLSISPRLTLVVFLTVIPMMALVMYLRYKVRKLFTLQRQCNSNRTAFLVESIMGEKIIKSYNRAKESIKTYDEIHDRACRTWLRIYHRNELNTPIVETFWNFGTVCLYAVSLMLILSGNKSIDAGTVVVFTSYMGLFSGPLTQIAVIIQQLAQVSSNLEQVFDLIDYPIEIDDNKEKSIQLNDVKGRIDFNHVTFGYEKGVNILEDFDLHVRQGETIALVGPTGAGKTTVINLLTRFYDVQEGSVTIDGVDVRDASLESLRKEVGVLMQEPFIFKGTIMENIRYGRPDATDEECIAAAKTIYADKFISRLADGYETVLEERGGSLSAGEKQLLSFARIILKNPSVVILDEATSSIDTETEILIKQALDIILKGKTAFMVAHRLSTIRNSDRILYIANKGIAEQGTHEELMALKGKYYALN